MITARISTAVVTAPKRASAIGAAAVEATTASAVRTAASAPMATTMLG